MDPSSARIPRTLTRDRAEDVIRSCAAPATLLLMPSVGPFELIIVLVIALLVFGPKRLPQLGRQLGSGMREFKDSITGDNKGDDDDDERPTLTRAEAPAATGTAVHDPVDAAHEPADEPAARPQP